MNPSISRAVVVENVIHNKHQANQQIALVKADGSSAFATSILTTATVIGTAAKVVASPAPAVNSLVAIKFTAGNNAASPTVAFNGGAAIPVLLGGTASAAIEITLGANGVALFLYDGTSLHQIGVYS